MEEECGGGPRGEEVQVVLTLSETAGSGGAASKHSVVFLFHRSLLPSAVVVFPSSRPAAFALGPFPSLLSSSLSCWRRGEERSVVERGKGRGSES